MGNILNQVMYHLVSAKDSTKNVVLKGMFSKELTFNVSTVVKSAGFLNDELAKSVFQKPYQVGTLVTGLSEGMQPFTFTPGTTATEEEIKTWAKNNGYTLIRDGVTITGPVLIGISVNAGKTVVTFTFDRAINNNLADNAAIKAATRVALTLGVIAGTPVALQAGDSVTTPNGAGTTYAVTSAIALTGAANAMWINAGTFKDANGLTNDAIAFNIDITSPAATFFPAGGATSISKTIGGGICITFAERLFKVSDHTPVVNADLTAATVIFKLTNAGGADVPCTREISADGKYLTITPAAALAGTQAYYIAITAFMEDGNQNAVAAANATWTTIA